MSETATIVGASGRLGLELCEVLGSERRIRGLSRTRPRTVAGWDWESAELLSPQEIQRVPQPSDNLVIYSAGLVGHQECEARPELAKALNCDIPEHIARRCQEQGARFVYVSTDAVFGGEGGNYSEADPTAPFSEYGWSKLAGENAVLASCEHALVIRTNFFGWFGEGRRSILDFFVQRLETGVKCQGYEDYVVSSAYVAAVAEALRDLLARDVAGVVHVASHDAASKYDFGVRVARALGVSESLVERVSVPKSAGVGGSRDLSLNCALAESLLGRPLTTLDDDLERAIRDRAVAVVGEPQ